MFRTVPLSIIRSFSLYTQQWYMSYRFADSLLSANLYVLLCVQWKTPDDGQRICPKHAEFHSKKKFQKLVHLVAYITRNLTRCTVTWMSDSVWCSLWSWKWSSLSQLLNILQVSVVHDLSVCLFCKLARIAQLLHRSCSTDVGLWWADPQCDLLASQYPLLRFILVSEVCSRWGTCAVWVWTVHYWNSTRTPHHLSIPSFLSCCW